MSDNTVQPDGQMLKRLRTEKGWSQEELAGRAIVSKKTVENIEAGKPTYAGTLAKLAKSLGIEAKQLLALDGRRQANCALEDQAKRKVEQVRSPAIAAGRDAEGADQNRSWIEIVIGGDLDNFTEEKERALFGVIKKLLVITGNIRLINIREGSVILTLELTAEQAKQLLQAVKVGALAEFGVLYASVKANPFQKEGSSDSATVAGSVKVIQEKPGKK